MELMVNKNDRWNTFCHA